MEPGRKVPQMNWGLMSAPEEAAAFDADAVHAKYREERDKRLVKGRAAIRDLVSDDHFSRYREDPFTPFSERDAVGDDVDVAIIGAGIGGVVVGAQLRRAGLKRIMLIDEAGGPGGTWYWNRYPGVMCDVESYIYMPMLEDLEYIPKHRYAFGDEIRSHIESIADKYDLVRDALFHSRVKTSTWDDGISRWIIRTDRGDEITARYLVLAVGILNLMKLPAIPGMEKFEGKSFHTARWDYDYTGGGLHGGLDKLADKVVAVLGTGASAIQCIPHLAESAKHVYVFQRTPSAVGVRGNRPTDDDFANGLGPGWQRERMYNFQSVVTGRPVDVDMTNDGWTYHMAKVWNPRRDPEMSLEDFMLKAEEQDFTIMEEHRARIEEVVHDPRAAEILKPYYRYLCKRPCFHDEYLLAYNRSNVTLISCPAGIERVTEEGLICDGEKFAFDCLIYATGFEPEVTPLPRRVGHEIVGRGGVTLAEKWAHGASTLHGMMTQGFPNMFILPSPGQQSATTTNFTLIVVEAAEHIGETVRLLEERGCRVFDVSTEAEAEYVEQIVTRYVDSSGVMEACTPSRLNNEGDPGSTNPRSGSWGGGRGDFFPYCQMLKEWRESGEFAGLELSD
jgi:cation diffusion facilitator CzcD-associated flavoprotein CzcO